MRKTIVVTLTIEIYDAEAFAATARNRAIAEGLEEEQAREYTVDDLHACAVMLFDPGASPKGCDILDSSAADAHDS